MYRRRRTSRVLLPALAAVLTVATLGSALRVLPGTQLAGAAAFFGGLVSAPGAALAAVEDWIDGKSAGPAAEAGNFFTAIPEAPAAAPPPAESASTASSAPTEPPSAPEEVPEGMASVIETHYGQGSGAHYIACGAASIKNCTDLPDAEVAAEAGQPLPFQIEPGSAQPQVLIMHTHATESYELAERAWCDPSTSARTTDNASNMVAVGAEIAAQLNAAGVNTIQDATLHDYPSYNGSYARSNATVRSYLAQYPSIKVVLDVHRDAIQKEDGSRVKPVAMVDGMKAAQVMIICGADNGGNLPNFKQNLRFAAAWEAKMEQLYPGLTRPVLFDYRYYNQDLTTGSLLIEMGGHGNTLEEAKYSGRLVGKALAALFTGG